MTKLQPGEYEANLIDAEVDTEGCAVDLTIDVKTPAGPERVKFSLKQLDDPDAFDRWDGYPASAWDKDSLAVVACDGDGQGCVLCAVGPHVRMEIEEAGLTTLSDLGLDDAPKGIAIWVGKYVWFNNSNPFGPDEGSSSEPRGAFRPPTEDEWTAIREGRCPWNDDDWRVE